MRKSYRKFNQKSLKTQLTKFYETFSHALIICNTNMSFLDWLASNLLSDFFYNWLPFLPIHHILKSSHLLVAFFSDWPYVRDPLRSFYFSYFFLHIQFTLLKQKIYSHQVIIYLDVPGIPVKEPLQNSWLSNWMYEVKLDV